MSGADRRLVLIAGTDPLDEVSGHRTYVSAHALAAALGGFAPHVFCVGPPPRVESTPLGTLHRIASPLRLRHTLLAAAHQPPLVWAVTRHIASAPGPHVIHSFGAWASTGVAISRALARRGVQAVPIASAYTTLAHEAGAKVGGLTAPHRGRRAVGYRISDLWVRAVASPSERRGYIDSARILLNYDSVQRLVTELCGPSLDIRRLPYAAPMAFRPDAAQPRPRPAAIARLEPTTAPLIVSVSRHDPRKGIDIMLRALAGLAADGIPARACLVGPGPLLAAHRSLAVALGLGPRVAITGHVDDVLPYLQQADVFVLPSLEEGSGSVSLLEALQAGLPVVASACDGIPEDVRHERQALLVAPGDVRALQTALVRVLADEPLRARLRAGARKAYEERFSGGALVAALSETYADFGLRPG
jgi:glycosyltransferase involved in cell wall biosynthesis